MTSYSLLAINVYINDVDFHYTECGTAKLLINRILDNKALYVYKRKNEKVI